jgi:signal transduction histidine kinase/ActR/RegA family two-component response regulator
MKPTKRISRLDGPSSQDRHVKASTAERDDDVLTKPIRHVMSRNLTCVFEHLRVETLEQILLERELSGVPVVDRDHRLVGFVAMTDIVRDIHARRDTGEEPAMDRLPWGFHEELQPATVSQLMVPVAFELQESCPIASAMELMASQHIHRVPVVSDEGLLVGMVTAGDVLRYLAHARQSASGPAEAVDARPEASAHEHASEADRLVSLGFLASSLAHEVNNALTPMRLSLGRLTSFELSRRPLSAARLHRNELLQDVREGVERIERIVRELRVFSHTGDTVLRPVEISEVLEMAIGLAAQEIKHRARLVRDYGDVPSVTARPAELRQAILNVLINAARAIPEGEAHLNEIRVTTRAGEHGFAIIEISDTGKGIQSDDLPRIFDPFFTTEPAGCALGLGLAVTRDVVMANGGDIAVDSVLGKGTTIRIALPPSEMEEPAMTSVHDAPPRQTSSERMRVLIVDDDRPVAAAIALELDEHDVVVAESGREALNILRGDKDFDVILCDLMMPEVSGVDVYEALRLLDPRLLERVVLMTGGAFTPRASEFLSSVNAPMLEKPFAPGQLRAIASSFGRRERAEPRPVDGAQADGWRPSDISPRTGA